MVKLVPCCPSDDMWILHNVLLHFVNALLDTLDQKLSSSLENVNLIVLSLTIVSWRKILIKKKLDEIDVRLPSQPNQTSRNYLFNCISCIKRLY